MEKKLKKALFHTKAAVQLIIKEDRAALFAIYTAFEKFFLIPVYIKKHINEPYFQRNLKMAKKMFTLTIIVLILALVTYIIAEENQYQDRPVQQRQLQRDPQLADRPLAGRGMLGASDQRPAARPAQPVQSLSAWFEAVKQAYNNGNEQRLNQLIRKMDNVLAQQDEATKGRPVVQTFEKWFTAFKNAHQMGEWQRMGNLIARYDQARGQIRGGIQQRLGQPQPDRPLQQDGPQTRFRGGQPQQTVPPAGQPGAGYGRGFTGGRGQPLAPQGPAVRGWQQDQPTQPQMRGQPGAGLGRGFRGGRGQPLAPQGPALRDRGLRRGYQLQLPGGQRAGRGLRGGRSQIILPPAQRGWGWRIDVRPLPPPERIQPQRDLDAQPVLPPARRQAVPQGQLRQQQDLQRPLEQPRQQLREGDRPLRPDAPPVVRVEARRDAGQNFVWD